MLAPKGKRSSKLRKFVLKFKSAFIRQPVLVSVDNIYLFNIESPYVISVIGLKHALQAMWLIRLKKGLRLSSFSKKFCFR